MEITSSFAGLPALLEKHYAVKVVGQPHLLHERDGQEVFQVNLTDSRAFTVRLCTVDRSYERVMGDTGALVFLNKVDFPAPRLILTQDGQRAFQWQPEAWGYVQEFIEGENPTMELPVLAQTGALLGRLHSFVNEFSDYPVQVGWLEERSSQNYYSLYPSRMG